MKLSAIIKHGLLLIVILISVMLGSAKAGTEPIAVIINNNNNTQNVSLPMLKRIYSNKLLKWPNGAPIILYDLDVSNPVRETFSTNVLGNFAEKIAEDWAHKKITNQAINPPHTLKSQRLVIHRVSLQKGAIGYVSLSKARGRNDIKVLVIIE